MMHADRSRHERRSMAQRTHTRRRIVVRIMLLKRRSHCHARSNFAHHGSVIRSRTRICQKLYVVLNLLW